MAKCYHCQAETELYVNDVPICMKCDDASRKREALPKKEIKSEEPLSKADAA